MAHQEEDKSGAPGGKLEYLLARLLESKIQPGQKCPDQPPDGGSRVQVNPREDLNESQRDQKPGHNQIEILAQDQGFQNLPSRNSRWISLMVERGGLQRGHGQMRDIGKQNEGN